MPSGGETPGSSAGPPGSPGDILGSWKGIAAYLQRDVRTVMRWERTRALPVHRLPGGTKTAVYALKGELEAWRSAGRSPPRSGSDSTAGAATPSIAVLPLANLTGAEEDGYFGDGLADEIINALTQVPGLRVIARSSAFVFREPCDVREIGSKLRVTTILEGSVRRVKGHVRVCAQLVETRNGYHLWCRSFDGTMDDPIALQDEIARAVVDGLKLQLAPRAVLVKRPTLDRRAYDLWLEGRRIQHGRRSLDRLLRSKACFEEALSLDPSFALAHVGLADHHREMALLGVFRPREAGIAGKAAVEKALEQDGEMGEAHAILGVFRAFLDFDWDGAERALRQALALAPASAVVHSRYAMCVLAPQLRFEEAEDELEHALSLDPLSPEYHCQMARVLLFQRRADEADARVTTALSLSEEHPLAHWMRGAIRVLEGRFEEACVHAGRALELFGDAPMSVAAVSCLYAFCGRAAESRTLSERLERLAASAFVSPLFRAWIHTGRGETEEAFRRLEEAIDERDPQAMYLACDLPYDRLRADPRFPRLLSRMNLSSEGEPRCR